MMSNINQLRHSEMGKNCLQQVGLKLNLFYLYLYVHILQKWIDPEARKNEI